MNKKKQKIEIDIGGQTIYLSDDNQVLMNDEFLQKS